MGSDCIRPMTSRAVCCRVDLAVAKPFMPGLANPIQWQRRFFFVQNGVFV